jgi:hypothetical protein
LLSALSLTAGGSLSGKGVSEESFEFSSASIDLAFPIVLSENKRIIKTFAPERTNDMNVGRSDKGLAKNTRPKFNKCAT